MDGAIPVVRGSRPEVQREARSVGGRRLLGRGGTDGRRDIDRAGRVVKTWVGPEVAWPRGGGLGGAINRPFVWLAFCLFFVIGLADFRRPLSIRNSMSSPSCPSRSISYFNEGGYSRVPSPPRFRSRISSAVPPGWAARIEVAGGDLAARLAPGRSDGAADGIPGRPQPPAGRRARCGVRRRDRSPADSGWHRALRQVPERETGRPCGQPTADGEIADWVPANGRCETALPLGDYGPVNYHAYLPGLAVLGWSGKWTAFLRCGSRPCSSTCWPFLVSPLSAFASAERGWRRSWRSLGRQTRSRSTCRAPTRTTRSCPRF